MASGCAHSHDSTSIGEMAKDQCHGANDCKGHGWMSMSKADCDTKGGNYVAKAH